jgi:hypothetical protein
MNARHAVGFGLAAIWINAAVCYTAIAQAMPTVLVPPLATLVITSAASTAQPFDWLGSLACEIVDASSLLTAVENFEHCFSGFAGRNDDRFTHVDNSRKIENGSKARCRLTSHGATEADRYPVASSAAMFSATHVFSHLFASVSVRDPGQNTKRITLPE